MRVFKIDDLNGSILEIHIDYGTEPQTLVLSLTDEEDSICIYIDKNDLGYLIEELKRHY